MIELLAYDMINCLQDMGVGITEYLSHMDSNTFISVMITLIFGVIAIVIGIVAIIVSIVSHIRQKKDMEELPGRILRMFGEKQGLQSSYDPRDEVRSQEAIHEIVGKGTRDEQRALNLIADGKIEEGFELLEQSATAVEQWRRFASILYLVDTSHAVKLYEKIVDMDSSNPWDSISLGRLYMRIADIMKAQETLSAAMRRLINNDERAQTVLHIEIARVYIKQGKFQDAMTNLQAGLDKAERLVVSDPSTDEWLYNLANIYGRMGEVHLAQGDLSSARESFVVALAMLKCLSASEPTNLRRQYALSAGYTQLGDVCYSQNALRSAQKNYNEGLIISERLVKSDRTNSLWTRAFAANYSMLGGIFLELDDTLNARKCVEQSLDLFKHLAASDPSNAEWQRDLCITHVKLGDVLLVQKETAASRENFKSARDIALKLGKLDPHNTQYSNDLIVIYINLDKVEPNEEWWGKALEILEELEAKGQLEPRNKQQLEELRERKRREDRSPSQPD